MILKSKIIAIIASLSMIATSFVALSTSASAVDASAPTVKAEIIAGNDTIAGTDLGVKFTFSNLTKAAEGLMFHIEIPATITNDRGKALTSLTNFKRTIQADEEVDPNPFLDGWDAVITGTDIYVMWLTYDDMTFGNDDWFELDFNGTYDLKAGDLKITKVELVEVGNPVSLKQDKDLNVVGPGSTTSSVSWTETAAGTDYAGQYDGSKAAAYTVELAGDGKTYNAITWKATKDGVTKGHVTALGQDLGGDGSFKFGIAIGGVATSELSDVQAAWGNQTPSSAE